MIRQIGLLVFFMCAFSPDVSSMLLARKTSNRIKKYHVVKRKLYYCGDDRVDIQSKTTKAACERIKKAQNNDRRRALHEAIRQQNGKFDLDQLTPYLPLADDYLPNGSTPALEVMNYIFDPAAKKTLIHQFLLSRANPFKAHAVTGERLYVRPRHIREIAKMGDDTMDDATLEFYYRWQLYKVKKLSDLLLVCENSFIVDWVIKEINAMNHELSKTQNGHVDDRVRDRFAAIINDAVAISTNTLLALSDPNFKDMRVLYDKAEVLASLGLIGRNEDDRAELSAAIKIAPELFKLLTFNVAQVLSSLMKDDRISLFYNNPDEAFLYLPLNFSTTPLPVLFKLEAQMDAYNLIKNTIQEIKTNDVNKTEANN